MNFHQVRLDQALAELIPDLSRRKIRKIIDLGGVYINSKRIRVASRLVSQGDLLEVAFDPEKLNQKPIPPYRIKEHDIVYFDHGLLAFNKPPGLASQATREQSLDHAEAAVNRYLKEHYGNSGPAILLHRLDKETSGVLLFALNKYVGDGVAELFRTRKMAKTYWAICHGIPSSPQFEVTCQLSAIDQRLGVVRQVHSGGKFSSTKFEVMSSNRHKDISLIRCLPSTGRSHQIRVHLNISGHSIVGDKRYGVKAGQFLESEEVKLTLEHHFLHASALEFARPNDQKIKIKAKPPQLFEKFGSKMDLNLG
jgi:RluA family pseudouridine synthase